MYALRRTSCDLLKIRYLCGRNDNTALASATSRLVVICSKFAIFAVEMTTACTAKVKLSSCDLLKIRYLCGRNDNPVAQAGRPRKVVICSKFAIFAVEMTTGVIALLVKP